MFLYHLLTLVFLSSDVLSSDCLGNVLRLELDGSRLAGKQVHVDVVSKLEDQRVPVYRQIPFTVRILLCSNMTKFSNAFSDGSDVVTITPFLAAQCGFSLNSDPWGNSLLYISLQHCYAQSRVWKWLKWLDSKYVEIKCSNETNGLFWIWLSWCGILALCDV